MSTPPPQGQNPFAQAPNPYGQQPPPQGGYGYPPQQGQPGGPQTSPYFNQGGPTAPMPPQRPRRGAKFYFRIVGGIVVVAVAIGGFLASRDDADNAKVGDCMSIGNPDSVTDPDLEVVDCSDSKAKYKVTQKKDGASGSCSDGESTYTQSGDGADFTLCLTDYTPTGSGS